MFIPKRVSVLLVFTMLVTLGSALMLAQAKNHSDVSSKPLKIFVTPLQGGDQGLDNMITAKLISHLVEHHITVVDSSDDADATLTGSGMTSMSSPPYIQAGLRLVDTNGV